MAMGSLWSHLAPGRASLCEVCEKGTEQHAPRLRASSNGGSQAAAEPEPGDPRVVRTASAGERRRRAVAEAAAGAAEAATAGAARELAAVRGQIEQMRR